MANVELILLQRVDKLGQMGEVVRVKPGFARNFLLPQKKAIRANKTNREVFETQRIQLEALNLKRREEAERLAERMGGLNVVVIRQAGESGSLYGSVSPRDIAEAVTQAGLTVTRQQVVLVHPIKSLGPRAGAHRLASGGQPAGDGQRGPQHRGSRQAGPRRAGRPSRRGHHARSGRGSPGVRRRHRRRKRLTLSPSPCGRGRGRGDEGGHVPVSAALPRLSG